jgi:uncharacterized protein YfbU (UPF0304 family)
LLINQYKILNHLAPSQVNDTLLSLLHSGYDSDFLELVSGHETQPLSDDVRREVRDIIHMFLLLGPANASPAANFSGFNPEDETDHYHYAMYVLQETADILPPSSFNYNTPFQTLPAYRAMLKEWRASCDQEHLTDDDVKRIKAKSNIGFPCEVTDLWPA